MECCGHEMIIIGMHCKNGELVDIHECVVCDRRTDREESKFAGGVLRADALHGRLLKHTDPLIYRPDVDGLKYAQKAERDESVRMNLMVSEMVSSHKKCVAGHQLKTREQRARELSVILEREVEP